MKALNTLITPAFETLFLELYSTHKPVKPIIPDNIMILIGKIIVKFQRLEMTMGYFITILLNLHSSTGDIITNELSFKNILSLLGTLHKEMLSDSKEMDILLKEARKIEEQRNKIIHSIWLAGNEPGKVTRLKKTNNNGNGKKITFNKIDTLELESIVDWIDKVDSAFSGLMFKEIIDPQVK